MHSLFCLGKNLTLNNQIYHEWPVENRKTIKDGMKVTNNKAHPKFWRYKVKGLLTTKYSLGLWEVQKNPKIIL